MEEDYGSRIVFDPSWEGPTKKNRRTTDPKFLIAMVIYVLFWAGISYYAISHGNISKSNGPVPDDVPANFPIFDFKNAGYIIPIYIAVSAVLTILYIVLLRWHAKFIVYLEIFFLAFAVFASSCYFISNYIRTKEMLAPAIIMPIMFLLLVVAVISFRNKISIACEVIREACKSVLAIPFTLVFPIIPYAFMVLVLSWTVATAIFLQSIQIQDSTDRTSNTPFYVKICHAINVVGGLWLTFFLAGTCQMVLSGAFSTWFWTREKKYLPKYVTTASFMTTIRYHLGTVAFGSLIITICEIISAIIQNIRENLRNSENQIAYFLCTCFSFLFDAFERLLKYINRNAYIWTATHGTDFLTSAKNAFNLIMRNVMKCYAINKVTDLIIFLGELLVVLIVVLTAVLYCNHNGIIDSDTSSAKTTVLVTVGIISFIMSACFFNVLGIAVDTLFLSALEDFERNDDTQGKPYFMSHSLKTLLIKDSYESIMP